MQKISTAVILGILAVVMLGVVIYLNRDKFGSKKAAEPAPEA